MASPQHTSTTTTDIVRQLAEHDRDLVVLRRDISAVQQSVEVLAGVVRGQDSKLDDIANLVRAKGATTMEDIARVLQVVLMGFALISGIVTGIVYIAGNANRTTDISAVADAAVMRYRMEQTESHLSRLRGIEFGVKLADPRDK